MFQKPLFLSFSLSLFLFLLILSVSEASPTHPISVPFAPKKSVYSAVINATYTADYTAETQIQTATGDTVLHVLEYGPLGYTQIAMSDDCVVEHPASFCPPLGMNTDRRSKVSFTMTQGKSYLILVRAYISSSTSPAGSLNLATSYSGETDLLIKRIDGNTNQSNGFFTAFRKFGGTDFVVNSVDGANYDPQSVYQYHLRHQPGSVASAGVYAFECLTGNYIHHQYWLSGIDGATAIYAANACYVAIESAVDQSTPYSDKDGMKLLVNDSLISDSNGSRDQDGDGLGLRLEEALGSCDRRTQGGVCSQTFTQQGTTNTVNQVFNLADTDGDGISDRDEVFAKESYFSSTSYGHPLYQTLNLPKMGSSPVIKDVYIEVDYHNTWSAVPYTETSMQQIQDWYNAGDAAHLNAVSSLGKIQLHFDVGFRPPLTLSTSEYIAKSKLYGDFGGSNVYYDAPAGNQAWNDVFNTNIIYNKHVLEIRRGIVRQAGLHPGGCTGQVIGTKPWLRLSVPSGTSGANSGGCVGTFSHELGHTLGLHHWGDASWGKMNGNPLYYSMMNYAYGNIGFFKPLSGNNPTNPLNPADLDENTPLGANFDFSYLANSPFSFRTVQQNNGGILDFFVDWNRNSFALPSSPNLDTARIRYPVTMSSSRIGFGAENYKRLINSASLQEAKSPKLIRFAPAGGIPRIYAFWVSNNGIKYIHAEINASWDSDGSCPGGSTIGSSCTSWVYQNNANKTPFSLAVPGGVSVQSLDVRVVLDAPSNGISDRMFLAYRDSNNTMGIVASATINTTNSSAGGLAPGQISLQSTSQATFTGVQGTPELQVTQLDGSQKPSELSVFFLSDGNNHLRISHLTGANASSWAWTSPNDVLDASGTPQPIVSAFGPTIVRWPHASHPNSMLCGVFPDLPGATGEASLRFHCRNGSGLWEEITQRAFGVENPPKTMSKPSMMFRLQRRNNGEPLELASGEGQFWLFVTAKVGNYLLYDFFVSRRHTIYELPTSTPPADPMFGQRFRFLDSWDRIVPGTSLSLLSSPDVGAPKGLLFWGNKPKNISDGTLINVRLSFLPFVDETVKTTLQPDSDFKILSARICRQLRGNTFCGAKSETRWGY